jgi:hypothetical protein
MNLVLDPSLNQVRTATAALVVLTKWYARHPTVRRLWAFSEPQRMRVIVTLEPTHDGDDIYPAWLANGHDWAHELQLRMDVPVQLEVTDAPFLAEPASDVDGVLVAALFWRDSSLPPEALTGESDQSHSTAFFRYTAGA